MTSLADSLDESIALVSDQRAASEAALAQAADDVQALFDQLAQIASSAEGPLWPRVLAASLGFPSGDLDGLKSVPTGAPAVMQKFLDIALPTAMTGRLGKNNGSVTIRRMMGPKPLQTNPPVTEIDLLEDSSRYNPESSSLPPRKKLMLMAKAFPRTFTLVAAEMAKKKEAPAAPRSRDELIKTLEYTQRRPKDDTPLCLVHIFGMRTDRLS
jgi:hypothetical protein